MDIKKTQKELRDKLNEYNRKSNIYLYILFFIVGLYMVFISLYGSYNSRIQYPVYLFIGINVLFLIFIRWGAESSNKIELKRPSLKELSLLYVLTLIRYTEDFIEKENKAVLNITKKDISKLITEIDALTTKTEFIKKLGFQELNVVSAYLSNITTLVNYSNYVLGLNNSEDVPKDYLKTLRVIANNLIENNIQKCSKIIESEFYVLPVKNVKERMLEYYNFYLRYQISKFFEMVLNKDMYIGYISILFSLILLIVVNLIFTLPKIDSLAIMGFLTFIITVSGVLFSLIQKSKNFLLTKIRFQIEYETIVRLQQGKTLTRTIAGVEHEIEVVNVNEKEDVCGVSVDGDVVFIKKGQTQIVNGVYIGVLDAVSTHHNGKIVDIGKLGITSYLITKREKQYLESLIDDK